MGLSKSHSKGRRNIKDFEIKYYRDFSILFLNHFYPTNSYDERGRNIG